MSGTGEVPFGHWSSSVPGALVKAPQAHGGCGGWSWDRRGKAKGIVPPGKETAKRFIAACDCPISGTEHPLPGGRARGTDCSERNPL